MKVPCEFGGPDHEYPDDWIFDGADGSDPAADPRWRGSTYVYFDERVRPIHLTQVPRCDDEAIDMFTFVANIGPGFKPRWIQATRPNGTTQMLPVEYDIETDTAYDRV